MQNYDYTETVSTSHMAGRTRNYPHLAPQTGIEVSNGYVHFAPYKSASELAEIQTLTRIMNGVANICAYVAQKHDITVYNHHGRLIDQHGDTYRGLRLRLGNDYLIEDGHSLEVMIDLPMFGTEHTLLDTGTATVSEAWVSPQAALQQMLTWAKQDGMHKNPEFPVYPGPLDSEELEALKETANILADTYGHYRAYSEGHCKIADGMIHLDVDPAAYLAAPRAEGSMISHVQLYSYVFADGRRENFKGIPELLEFAQRAHAEEFARDYSDDF